MMNRMIIRTNPFGFTYPDFVSMRQLVNDTIGQTDLPALNVTEDDNAYTVQAALPGWKPEEVNITLEDGVVTLAGEAKEETANEDKPAKTHIHEIQQRSFARRLHLPMDVEADKVDAHFENGMLMLTLPKAEVVKPKQIKINVK